MKELAREGFKVVTIVDPGARMIGGSAFCSGPEGGCLRKTSAGWGDFLGRCGPEWPGSDFSTSGPAPGGAANKLHSRTSGWPGSGTT